MSSFVQAISEFPGRYLIVTGSDLLLAYHSTEELTKRQATNQLQSKNAHQSFLTMYCRSMKGSLMATTLMPFWRQALKTRRPIRPKLGDRERERNKNCFGKMMGNFLGMLNHSWDLTWIFEQSVSVLTNSNMTFSGLLLQRRPGLLSRNNNEIN